MRWLLAVALSLSLSGCLAVTGGGIRSAPRPAASGTPRHRATAAPTGPWQGWLLWTNPPDLDLAYLRFYVLMSGHADTLVSDPFPMIVFDDDGNPVHRSLPGARDSCRFTIPRGAAAIWVKGTDTTNVNTSGESNHVSVTQP